MSLQTINQQKHLTSRRGFLEFTKQALVFVTAQQNHILYNNQVFELKVFIQVMK